MTPKAQRGTPEGDATLALQKLARESGAHVQELQTLYVLEAFLSRLAASPYRDDFVLKGGVLLAAFAARRPTKDVDFQATGFSNDVEEVAGRLSAIAAIEQPDGVNFIHASLVASAIRDGETDTYSGVRVRLVGLLGRARLRIGIDVSFGDPIWPEAQFIEVPRIVPVEYPPVVLRGYPLTMVLAEKIVTMVDRGPANTRWRDFADVFTLANLHPVEAAILRGALEVVASYRGVTLGPLLPTLGEMPEHAQTKWRTWRVRARRQQELPESFSQVLTDVALFCDPVLQNSVKGTWDAARKVW